MHAVLEFLMIMGVSAISSFVFGLLTFFVRDMLS